MIQLMVKLRFVERYCNPLNGWAVFVDSDASEEGRTGSTRKKEEAKALHARVLKEAPQAKQGLAQLGVHVGRRKQSWSAFFGNDPPVPRGDRDVIAVHVKRRLLWIAEVEGESRGQPEGKIYRALGQLVCAADESRLDGYKRFLSVVVWGDKLSAHLARASAAARIGISGLVICQRAKDDQWILGEPPPLDTCG